MSAVMNGSSTMNGNSTASPVLQATGLVRRFGALVATDNVSLS